MTWSINQSIGYIWLGSENRGSIQGNPWHRVILRTCVFKLHLPSLEVSNNQIATNPFNPLDRNRVWQSHWMLLNWHKLHSFILSFYKHFLTLSYIYKMPRRISKSKFDPQRARSLWLRPTPIRFQCYTDRIVLWWCRYFLLFELLCSKSYWRIGQDQRPTGSWGPRRQLGWTATLWSSTSWPSLERWAIKQYRTDTP